MIGIAIEQDVSLLRAPISRQFEDLILEPCRNHHSHGTFVIVIDAFDESSDDQPPDSRHPSGPNPQTPSEFYLDRGLPCWERHRLFVG